MTFSQLIPFNPANGGTTPNLCLANVCAGYGIGNKYATAWEAWEHTQQHPDSNIPSGLAVPLYYSYTTTIDGVTQNYGHINVQLPDGTVWSDGNIYASVDDYMAKKQPKFVGWGESVNDSIIIKEDEDTTMTEDGVRYGYLAVTRAQPTQPQLDYWIGRPSTEFTEALWKLSDYYYGAALAQIAAMQQPTVLPAGFYQFK